MVIFLYLPVQELHPELKKFIRANVECISLTY